MKSEKAWDCYHCHQRVAKGEEHDCWSTTEAKLTADLSDDLREAYARLRATAADFGEQRIYASHKCVMFSREVCYFFVRPGKKRLEIVIFLGRPLDSPIVRRTERPTQAKFAHVVHVVHRDEVEEPLTDWLREAYDVSESLSARPAKAAASAKKAAVKKPVKKAATVAKKTAVKKTVTKKAAVKKPVVKKRAR